MVAKNNGDQLDRSDLLQSLAHAATEGTSCNILLAGPWGSGKTSLLRDLQSSVANCSATTTPHVLWFSPWDTIADGDARMAFLRLLQGELKPAMQKRPQMFGRFGVPLLKMLEDVLAAEPSKSALSVLSGGLLGGHEAFILGNFVKFGRILAEHGGDESSTSSEGKDNHISAVRKAVDKLLRGIAEANGKERILLLVDDLDRARPEEAVTILDSLYHLLMPQDHDSDNWPLTSIWAVNTSVLEEFLYREYRELPSFDPNAYLEKLFRQRINVPPLFNFGGEKDSPTKLWASAMVPYCAQFRKRGINVAELASKLAAEVSYAALGNLRLHDRVRRDCIHLWSRLMNNGEHEQTTLGALVREARLIVLVDVFPYFREQIAPFNGMWQHFINQLNRRLTERPMEWIANPLYRHVDSPDLATLLVDLGVIRYDTGRSIYELLPDGRARLQNNLNQFWQVGV